MTPRVDEHGAAHAELLFVYAIQALPAEEIPIAETNLAACTECRRELAMLRPVVDFFVGWPTDLLRPSATLWQRLAQRTGADPTVSAPRAIEPDWDEVAPGISCRLLATDSENDRVSMLVRLAPGVAYPPHRHGGVEELHLLDGELFIDDRKLYPGDYNRAEAGTVDQRVWSETGCTCLLVTSTRDELR